MKLLNRAVHIGLSPNLSPDLFLKTAKIFLKPWLWNGSTYTNQIENWFRLQFKDTEVATFFSGRQALYVLLEALSLDKNSEVLLQAFTCVALPNSIKWAGLIPIYVDIDRTLNFNVPDAEKKLTKKTKVVIVQHTFGVAANIYDIQQFCRKHNLFLIEDCAHALGATYQDKPIGMFGDAAFFSFGRDKIVSSVWGGVTIVKNKEIGERVAKIQKTLKQPPYILIFRELLHPLLTFISLYTYRLLGLGKIILFLSQKTGFLSLPVTQDEKKGEKPEHIKYNYPNAFAGIVISQLLNLDKSNQQRRLIAQQYFKELKNKSYDLPEKMSGAVYLRFNILSPKADELRFRAKKQGMILGNWYSSIIDPEGSELGLANYSLGSCPNAEKAARESLNLPSYPLLEDTQIKRIIRFLTTYPEYA